MFSSSSSSNKSAWLFDFLDAFDFFDRVRDAEALVAFDDFFFAERRLATWSFLGWVNS